MSNRRVIAIWFGAAGACALLPLELCFVGVGHGALPLGAVVVGDTLANIIGARQPVGQLVYLTGIASVIAALIACPRLRTVCLLGALFAAVSYVDCLATVGWRQPGVRAWPLLAASASLLCFTVVIFLDTPDPPMLSHFRAVAIGPSLLMLTSIVQLKSLEGAGLSAGLIGYPMPFASGDKSNLLMSPAVFAADALAWALAGAALSCCWQWVKRAMGSHKAS